MTDPATPRRSPFSAAWTYVWGESVSREDTRADRGPADSLIVVLTLALLGFGLVMVYSASALEAAEATGNPFFYLIRQGIAAVLGLAGMAWFARQPTWRYGRIGWMFYVAVFAGLVLVFVPGIGQEANGSSRWIGTGGLRLQPSEFLKIALILVLAERINRMAGGVSDLWRGVLPVLAIAVPPMLLVLAEIDLGTTVVIGGIVALILYMGGMRKAWFGVLAGLGAAGVVGVILTQPYQIKRVTSWLDPWKYEQDGGYQVIQSWVALHRGGFDGQGLGIAMSKMKFLPFAHTDFVAAVVGEELGFLGVLGLISLYSLLIWRGIEVATRARSYHGTLLAGAVTASLGMQTLFNLGVIMGLVPPKGLVLPFMSYGASALIANLWSIGILLSVSAETQEAEEPARSDGARREPVGVEAR